jgi:small subunit ribosomal protein S21
MEQILRSHRTKPDLVVRARLSAIPRALLAVIPQKSRNYQRFIRRLPSVRRILEVSQLGLVGGVFFLAEVRVQEGEPLENALRRFKRKVQTEDIIKEVKRHSFYLKPGEKKRVKEALARKRNRKKVRKEQD